MFVHDSCQTCAAGTRQGTYLFYPLKEGFAGVLLSERFVSDNLMAGSVKAAIASPETAIAISDENQRVLYTNGAAKNGYLVESNFDRPFSNWRAGIGLKTTSLEEIGRGSFIHSVAATILILLILVIGIALTIRATDRDAMAQAISNLLDNAIKYSRDKKQLSITTDQRGSDLSVEIADQGIGIPRAEQAKIFEKFYRVGNGLVHDVTRTVDNHIARLRQKIEPDPSAPQHIITVHGLGYRFIE